MSLLNKVIKIRQEREEWERTHPEEAKKKAKEKAIQERLEQERLDALKKAEEKKKPAVSKSKETKKKKVSKTQITVVKEVEPLLDEKNGIYKYIDLLLQDRTTGENIIFAEDEYEGHSPDEHYTEEVMKELIASKKLNYRVRKSLEQQKGRTKKKAEVFTPSWICKDMIDMCQLPKNWEDLIQSTVLEITCGEGVFLVSPYDATTGEEIKLKDRIGILDRKLQAINKHIKQEAYKDERSYKRAWMQSVIKAYQTTYGYEWQGDNLFIARINLLQTFFDYFEDKWSYQVSNPKTIEKIIEIITYNIWQMDGLKDVIPMTEIPAKIMDWETNEFIEFKSLKV